jgi:hypothetical protein
MKTALITVLLTLGFCFANAEEKSASLDGKTVVLEGRWNGRAKNVGQMICSIEPKIVEVSDFCGRPSPANGDFVRVTGVLHWRPSLKEEKPGEIISDPGTCDCYYLDWSTAKWEKISPSQKKEANQAPEPTTTAVTGCACAHPAPAVVVAHL